MTVFLVGAGPGDPGLVTVRGARLLGRADVVVYDRLVHADLLGLARPGAELVDVGKRPGDSVSQEAINALLVARGRGGGCVVRLKGGDPFVFGRGGEEALALRSAGVPFEVVPGVSAAVAVPGAAGIPLTHRGLASGFSVVTGHGAGGEPDAANWADLARPGHTLVVLMGAGTRATLADRLLGAGRDPATPVAVIAWGTYPAQVVERTTLGDLASSTLGPPVTIVVGEVAALELEWWSRRPLAGQRVVVTRAADQAGELLQELAELGAEVVALPVIALAPPSDGGRALRAVSASLASADWVVLTSANGAARLLEAVPDARAFGRARIAAIGPGTAATLAAAHLLADLVPPEYVAESLLAAFPSPPPGGGRVLLVRAEVARDLLPEGLRRLGWEVEVVPAYRTVRPGADPAALASARGADWVTLTASSTVTGFAALIGGASAFSGRVAAIGPVTAEAARRAGFRVDAEASPHTIPGLVEALVRAVAQHQSGRP